MGEHKNLWWAIAGVLAGMGQPYVDSQRRYDHGGALDAFLDELPQLYQAGVRAVVCLLNIPTDAPVFQSAGFEFRCFPVADGHPPSLEQVREFIAFVESCRSRNLPVAVFCFAGVGRTGTMICCYLIHLGKSATEAIAHVRTVEPAAVETVRQIQFLEQFEKIERANQR